MSPAVTASMNLWAESGKDGCFETPHDGVRVTRTFAHGRPFSLCASNFCETRLSLAPACSCLFLFGLGLSPTLCHPVHAIRKNLPTLQLTLPRFFDRNHRTHSAP